MIPNSTKDVQVINNMVEDPNDTGQFSVDEASLAKIMSVLTNLYSDPEGAVVREYLTNALDAQIEAQNNDPAYIWRPIQVTTPSHFSKEYKVRDFGIGMDGEDIREIYSKYGKSTKESSNDYTGMLGLGSKCALTYTGQFTITGYKNGVRTRAVISKDENDIPIFMIVDTRATDEPNGVEISVPVRDRNSFAEKTASFLRWWEDGQVLVDGKEPVKHGFEEVKPGVFKVTEHNYSVNSYVIMGNVPYRVDPEYVSDDLRQANLGFAAYVPMGTVAFPPSREELFYNSKTKKAVAEIGQDLFEHMVDSEIKAILAEPTHRDAYVKRANAPYGIRTHSKVVNLKYKGDSFIDYYNIENSKTFMSLGWSWDGRGNISKNTKIYINGALSDNSKIIVVTGVDPASTPTSYFKKKVAEYYRQTYNQEATNAFLIMNDGDIDTPWLAHIPRVDSDTIKAVKLPRNSTASSGPKEEPYYEWYEFDGTQVNSGSDQTFTTKRALAYVSPAAYRDTYRKSGTSPEAIARTIGKDYRLVTLGKNQFDKFLRNNPGAVPLHKVFTKILKDTAAKVSAADVQVDALSYGEKMFLSKVDGNEIDDPDLVYLISTYRKTGTNYRDQVNIVINIARSCDITLAEPVLPAANREVIKEYPLLDRIGAYNMEHAVIYCNAVYGLNNP